MPPRLALPTLPNFSSSRGQPLSCPSRPLCPPSSTCTRHPGKSRTPLFPRQRQPPASSGLWSWTCSCGREGPRSCAPPRAQRLAANPGGRWHRASARPGCHHDMRLVGCGWGPVLPTPPPLPCRKPLTYPHLPTSVGQQRPQGTVPVHPRGEHPSSPAPVTTHPAPQGDREATEGETQGQPSLTWEGAGPCSLHFVCLQVDVAFEVSRVTSG